MKTLVVKYPDTVKAMIISHINIADKENWNMGCCQVTTPVLEKGEVEIEFTNVIDNKTNEPMGE